MLRYAMYVTMSIASYILKMHSFGISFIVTFVVAPERIKKSISGPRPKKVVHR